MIGGEPYTLGLFDTAGMQDARPDRAWNIFLPAFDGSNINSASIVQQARKITTD